MKTITSFKIAGLITACLFAAMPTKRTSEQFLSKHRLPV